MKRGLIAAVLLATPAGVGAQVLARAPSVQTPPLAQTSPAAIASDPVKARPRHNHTPGDPIEGVNRGLFSVHQFLDRIFFRPVAMAYKAVVPKVVRTGVRHVISNLTEPVVFLNDVLQLKPKRAVRTFGRFTINTVLGVGGVIDVAKGEKLPHRDNGFGNTLGRYGVGPGPYLFIPLIGPTDFRDLIGGQADGGILPLAVGDPFNRTAFVLPYIALDGLDQRVESDGDLKALLSGAADPYATLRSVYLQSRAAEVAEVRHGKTGGALDDPLVDPEAPTDEAVSSAQPDVFDTTPTDPEPNPKP
ncbi:MlaA family lipoprotein [Sphingomonas paeninsulae]|uniref:MlaA family lipoprotein n=1 Tax=Sphingomonas paeninsulae TaxID=2319844 RepID=UPI001EF05D86|nr:VacJ family lipoprotein [Sphingomonas paeninsulae]